VNKSLVAFDLEALTHYFDEDNAKYCLRIFGKFMTKSVLEVGAGTGQVSELIAAKCEYLMSLEPSASLFKDLLLRTGNFDRTNSTTEEYKSAPNANKRKFDCILYWNVLEHILDDSGELRTSSELLSPDGLILIYIPAHPWLYSDLDKQSGHYRRYTRKTVKKLLNDSGLNLVSLKNFETMGLIPYLIIYRLLRSTSAGGFNGAIFSKAILPLSYCIYKVGRGKIPGKGYLIVAKR